MSDEAKAAMESEYLANRPRTPKRAPRWLTFANGRIYRPTMKLMHRLGWCYPQRVLVDERSVWCHWCGMRGHR